MTIGEVFTGLGFMVGATVFYFAARARKMDTDGIGIIVVVGFFCGVVGAKVTQFIASGWPVKVAWTSILNPELGGKALLGGLVFGWLGVWIAKRRLGVPRSTGDLFALALPAGEAVGRIGCYFNGCCYGKESNVPWAIYQHGAWRHPTQFYSGVTALAVFAVLLWVRPKFAREGDLFKLYLGAFALTRFVIEFFRAQDTIWFGLSPMQWGCIELALYVAITLAIASRNRAQVAESHAG